MFHPSHWKCIALWDADNNLTANSSVLIQMIECVDGEAE